MSNLFRVNNPITEKSHPTRFYSTNQEKQVAKTLGGKCTSNSGATDFGGKGDILTDDFLLECKTRTSHSKSISIQKEWFEKNIREQVSMRKPYSAVVFNFGPNEENYYIIDEHLFKILIEKLKESK